MEFQPVIDRKVNRARLVLHSFLNASISSEDYTVKSLNRSADEGKNETEDHTFSMLHQALHGGARSIVVRDGDWLFLHSGGSGGNVESNVVLALRLTLRGEENPHPDPGPVPEWKKSMRSTLKETKPDRLPSNNVRLHHLAQMMTEKTTVNMYLTNDLQTRSRKGKLTVNLPDNENWSVKNYLDHVRKRTDVEYDLLPNLVVLRGKEENDFQRRELYFYDLSNYTETVEHPSLPDKLRTEVKTEGKKAKSGGGGKEGGSSSFVGSSFSTSRKKSDRFGAGMQPDELKGVIQKSVDSVSERHSMINVVGNRLLAVYNRPQVHHRVASIVRETASFPRLTDFVHVSLHSIYSEQKQRLLESIPLEQRLTEQQTDTLQSFLRKDEVVTRGQWTMASTGPESMFAAGGESVTGPESLSPTLKENAGAFDPQIVSKRATLAIQSRTMVPAHGENKKMRVLLRISEGRFTRSLPEMKKRLEGGDVLTLPVKKRDQLFSWQLPRAGTVVSFLGSDASTRPVLIRVRIWQSERSED